jgi:hypothetical protein
MPKFLHSYITIFSVLQSYLIIAEKLLPLTWKIPRMANDN